MCDAMDHLEAGEQLFAMQAVQHGALAADNPKDTHVRRATDALMRAAKPEPDADDPTRVIDPAETM